MVFAPHDHKAFTVQTHHKNAAVGCGSNMGLWQDHMIHHTRDGMMREIELDHALRDDVRRLGQLLGDTPYAPT